MKHRIIITSIMLLNCSSLVGMEQEQKFPLADHIKYIAEMHRSQDAHKINPKIPPLVFSGEPNSWSGTYALDPSSRNFYKERTVMLLEESNNLPVNLSDKLDCVYEYIKPTNLLIACLEQKEEEVKRLLKYYPLILAHVIYGDHSSNVCYFDPSTKELFGEALSASRLIPDNKTTYVLLKHAGDEKDLAESMTKGKLARAEIKSKKQRDEEFYNVFNTARNLPYEQQKIIVDGKFKKEFNETMQAVVDMLPQFTPEQEAQARREFEEMILETVNLPNSDEDCDSL